MTVARRLALLANAIANGAGLVALILMFGTISGAHFNPVVTLSEAWQRNMPAREVLPAVATRLFCWRYPAAPEGATVAGTVAPATLPKRPAGLSA